MRKKQLVKNRKKIQFPIKKMKKKQIEKKQIDKKDDKEMGKD